VGQVTADSAPAPPSTKAGPSSVVEPDPPAGGSEGDGVTRYRCAGCGNLTRFSVVTNRRTRAFHHFSVGGDLSVEDVEVLDESVEEVSCRWCGHGNGIEIIEEGSPRPG
jgi:hypothetical protein